MNSRSKIWIKDVVDNDFVAIWSHRNESTCSSFGQMWRKPCRLKTFCIFFKPHYLYYLYYLYLLWICWTTCGTSYNRSKACNKSATSGRAGGNWHKHVHKKSAINPQQIAVMQFEQVWSYHLSFTWSSLPEDEVGCWDEVRYSVPRDISTTATVWPIFMKFGKVLHISPSNLT